MCITQKQPFKNSKELNVHYTNLSINKITSALHQPMPELCYDFQRNHMFLLKAKEFFLPWLVVQSSQSNYPRAQLFYQCRVSDLVFVLEQCLQLINPCVSMSCRSSRKHCHLTKYLCYFLYSIGQNPFFLNQLLGSCFMWMFGCMVYDIGCETSKKNPQHQEKC